MRGPKPPTTIGGGGEGRRNPASPAHSCRMSVMASTTRWARTRVRVDRLPDRRLLDRIRRAPAAARAEPQEQPAARDRLERRGHVGEDAGMAVGHVEDERAEHDPPRDFRQCRQHRPRLGDSGLAGTVGVAEVIPRPDPVEAGFLRGQRGGAHVGPASTHRNQEQVGLHDALAPREYHSSMVERMLVGTGGGLWMLEGDTATAVEPLAGKNRDGARPRAGQGVGHCRWHVTVAEPAGRLDTVRGDCGSAGHGVSPARR